MPVPPTTNWPGLSITYDRVCETTTTSGTGTVTLAGAAPGYQSFAAVGDGNYCYYTIADPLTGDWETGIGHYTSSGTTLSRDRVLSSSNAGSAVSFAANAKDVFLTLPATAASRTLFTATATVAVSNTTAETTLISANGVGSASIQGNYFYPGKTVRATLRGAISTAGTPGTLNIKYKLGSLVLCSTGAITLPGSLSDVYWEMVADLTCYSAGASGTAWAQGRAMVTPATLSPSVAGMATTATSTVDTTVSQAVDITATWGTASTSNILSVSNCSVEAVN